MWKGLTPLVQAQLPINLLLVNQVRVTCSFASAAARAPPDLIVCLCRLTSMCVRYANHSLAVI